MQLLHPRRMHQNGLFRCVHVHSHNCSACVYIVWSQSALCYGLLQSNPRDHLDNDLMRFSDNDTLYLYTSLLSRSTCRSGILNAFSFCYRPTCGNETRTGNPEFYILLLVSGEFGYSPMYVHEELHDQTSCEGNSGQVMLPSCKQVSVNSSVLITVDSSYSLAVIVPGNVSGNYLYEIESKSLGIISSPPSQIPRVGEMLELVERTPSQIRNRLLQIQLEPVVSS